MKIHFDEAADAAKIGAEPEDQQTGHEVDHEPVVAANDNGLSWPLILFPEDWWCPFEERADQPSQTDAAQPRLSKCLVQRDE
jgi:hypothetical protein